MVFLLKLFLLVILSSLVQSKETIKVWKSIKLNEKMMYDCVDIYKQPSLDHPLLQNHKIQMEPSFSTPKSKNQVVSEMYEKIIDCPNGTVPILRNTKAYVANAQYFAKKHFDPLTVEKHGEHISGIRSRGQGPYYGVSAMLSIHDLNIDHSQSSSASIYLAVGGYNSFNLIEMGWMVNPDLFGDGRPWGYGFWKGAKGAGCYNTICPGFVQVSKTNLLSEPLPEGSPEKRYLHVRIQQDKVSGHWWATDEKHNKPDIHIGYWPKEIFDLIGYGADTVGVGGVVQASPSGKSAPMGNGHLPTSIPKESARVLELFIIDSRHKRKSQSKFEFELLFDSNKCYGFKTGYYMYLFMYGGPGGDSCGI